MLDQITPVILSRDEEVNIGRTLGQLTWARHVIVADSMSTDATARIAQSFPNVVFVQRPLDTIAGQSIFAIEHAATDWVLLLDADYYVTDELVRELSTLAPPPEVDGFIARFLYAINGVPLRASLYPPRIVLLRKDRATIWQDGHTPRISVSGVAGRLNGRVIHDDRKDFRRFLARQRRYMREEASKIRGSSFAALPWSGRIRKMIVVAPLAVLLHTLIVRGVILDGLAGLRYATERFVAELILSRELLRSSL